MTRNDLLDFRSIPNVAAFLRLLRQGESSQDESAYTIIYGGSHFESFANHPNVRIWEKDDEFIHNGVKDFTTAAGAYQITNTTWRGLVKQYGFSDFTPPTQDIAAIALIAERKALDDVIAGRIDEAIRKLRAYPAIWASLPGATTGQPTQKYQAAIAVFIQYGGTLAENDPARAAPPRKETVMAPLIPILLESLIPLIPQLGAMFAKGEVAQRNVAAAQITGEAITKAVGAINLQEAAEKIQKDPDALDAAKQAVAQVVMELGEVGGGIDKARKDHAMPDQIAFYKNPAFLIALVLIPLIYMVAVAVLFGYGGQTWSDEIKAMVVTGIIAGLMGSITGFFLGSSLGSQKKDAALAR